MLHAIHWGGCIDSKGPDYNTGNLNFIITTGKTQILEGDLFNIHMVLTNVDNETINVWEMDEQVSYDIHVYDSSNNEVLYDCWIFSNPTLRTDGIIELQPGESIDDTRSSRCWNFTEGEYTLNATYHTSKDDRFNKLYWLGKVESNEVSISIIKPAPVVPDPLRFSIHNPSSTPHEIRVDVFNKDEQFIFSETYFINSSEETSYAYIQSPIVTETLGTYKYVIMLDNDFTTIQFVKVRYSESLSSSDYLLISITDNKENPLELDITIA